MPKEKPRYAIYAVPPRGSALWKFGSAWLGRDAEAGEILRPPKTGVVKRRWIEERTATPRRYGFHGTLKAPFRLKDRRSEKDLSKALKEFAAGARSLKLGEMSPGSIGNFVALTPLKPSMRLAKLAADCTTQFEKFRAKTTDKERGRWAGAGLSKRQRNLLEKWGYPYVLDEFVFHMTLSDALKKKERTTFIDAVYTQSPNYGEPFKLTEIALFREPGEGGPFELLKRFPLGKG